MMLFPQRWLCLVSGLLVALAVASGESPTVGATITVQPYITWVDQDRVTIQWETDVPTTSIVEYGLNSGYGQTASALGLSTVHKVVVNGLTKETSYFYRAASSTGAGSLVIYSLPYSFHTAVDPSTPFRFAFMGDTHTNDGGPPVGPGTVQVASAIRARSPDLVVHSGDLIKGVGSASHSDTEQQYRTELFAAMGGLMSTTPYMVAIGDHERRGIAGDEVYATYFDGHESPYWGKTYYTFTYGNARFIMLDSVFTWDHAEGVEVPGLGVGSDQYNWLVNTLQNNTSDWTFLSYHYCTYHSDPRFLDRYDVPMRALIGPLCDQYGVDMVMTGHAHLYERTYPIEGGVRNDANGTIYVTAGIGGGSLMNAPPGSALTAAKFSDYGYGIVDVNGGHVRVTTYDVSGNIRDQLSLPKSIPSPALLLTGHWTFDDISGATVPDSAGRDDTGTLTGAVTVVPSSAPVPGGTTSALSFNGVRGGATTELSLVDTGNLSPGAGYWSFEAWINPTSVSPADDSGRQALYNDFGAGSNVLQAYLTNDELSAYWRNGAGVSVQADSVGAALQANTWQHVKLERAGDNLNFYVNGVSVGTAALPSGFDVDTSGGLPPIFGHHGSAGMYWVYRGKLDEVRMSDVLLLPGDANLDGKVDDLDASILAANWQRTGGATWGQGDFNNDGKVDDLDASILAANWQAGVAGQGASSTPPSVPEPSTMILLMAGAFVLLAKVTRHVGRRAQR